MAKKKSRKLIKLNNKVLEIFGGTPFDEAVATLSDDVLMELALIVDAQTQILDRATLIRTLRKIWSERNIHNRSNIVSYLFARHRRHSLPSSASDAPSYGNRVEKIVSILSEIEHTPDEEESILERFAELKPEKITHEKISNTIKYIRLNKHIRYLEEKLQVEFNTSAEMEFYHQFFFSLPRHDFCKTLLVRSGKLETLDSFSCEDEYLRYLDEQKQALIVKGQAQLDTHITRLYAKPHPYLTDAQIEDHLRKMPPESDVLHAPIDNDILRGLVVDLGDGYRLIDLGVRYKIERSLTAQLHGATLPYHASITYDKHDVYAMIWRGDHPLPIVADIEAARQEMLLRFETATKEIFDEARSMAHGLEIGDETVWDYVHRFVDYHQLIASESPKLKRKMLRRVLYHFGEYLRPLRDKKRREELLAKTIRDFKNLFPLARSLKRKIIFYAGPTNSGKTHAAMEKLLLADTGYYLAPLRLLALEGYESMKSNGVPASLITGEEEIVDEESTHISSTIEMLNFEVDVECCVIDEIQMIADRDRGWAWANALIGAPAKTVVLTGSADAVSSVSELAAYLGEELEVVYFERKNPLEVMSYPTPLKKIKPSTAIVAFSRKEVLSYKQRLSSYHNVSVVYGNLSPEVRREEARKFREGESDILIATDAIAMGLNLPIQTLLFARDNKFDGLRRRKLNTSEILQIAGRAGRYGMHEHGFIGALDAETLRTIEERFHDSLPDIELPFSVMASLHHVELIGEILETENLLDILTFFAENMEFEGPFRAANIESMLEIAEIVDGYELDLRSRYHLATAPVSINSPYIESAFHRYLKHLERDEPVPYFAPRDLPSHAHTNEELLRAEDRVKEVSLYLWLGFRFADKFPDTEAAIEARTRLNRFIEKSLAKGDFVKRCKRCGKVLDFSYRYSICESCYRKGKQGFANGNGGRRKNGKTIRTSP